jgi:hypothetical protein
MRKTVLQKLRHVHLEQKRAQKCSSMFELCEEICLPRRLGTKYCPLSEYLARRARYGDFATLTFAKIESIIGANLPSSASQKTQWWNNAPSRVQAQASMTVGCARE